MSDGGLQVVMTTNSRIEKLIQRNTTHGLSRVYKREYSIWKQMRSRCLCAGSSAFHRYGGRGISICDEWNNFAEFIKDMGECPPGLTIDRIDNDKGYSPDNCRWADKTMQARNRSSTKLNEEQVAQIRASDGSSTYLSKIFGVSRGMIHSIRTGRSWKSTGQMMT